MKITIAHLFPDLLNLYGDLGNIASLTYRMQKRGFEVCVKEYAIDEKIDFENTDIIYLGGGAEKEQVTVCTKLFEQKDEFENYISNDGVMLATCTGFEILGNSFETESETHKGLGIIDIKCVHGKERFIDDVIVECDLIGTTVVGFENHISRIFCGNIKPLGKVLHGSGNNGEDKTEGAIFKNLVATSLHGPLLPKNPKLTDWLISKILERKGENSSLAPLDDSEENAAHGYITDRFLK